MATNKESKENLHKKNKHQNGYNFEELCKIYPALTEFVFINKFNTETIDFANPKAVKAINTALLFTYGIHHWEFPDENLCPPIPGRVDYIHYLYDLLTASKITNDIRVLDVGTGANCIYPLLGNSVYNWNFVGTDCDKKSLECASTIIKENKLSKFIQLQLQSDTTHIFEGILTKEDKFSAAMCNPPFYKSQEDAMQANARKLEGLGKVDVGRNFGGKQQELWYNGGEKAFAHTFLYESSHFKTNCFWFTSLVSKKENAESMIPSLKKLGATEIKTIPMHQGNKVTRIVAWTFLSKEEQLNW
jgi:23S rRNA (adenine1618-N6)-methyltransferase